MSQGTFSDTLFDWKLLKEYLYFIQKSAFFPRGKSTVFGQK